MRLLIELYRFKGDDELASDALQLLAVAGAADVQVTLFTAEPLNRLPQLPPGKITLHKVRFPLLLPPWIRYQRFVREFTTLAANNYDAAVAFDEIPGGDFHIARQYDWLHPRSIPFMMTPGHCKRYLLRQQLYLPPSNTIICYISAIQRLSLQRRYGLAPERLKPLPPGVPSAYSPTLSTESAAVQRRRAHQRLAEKLGFSEESLVLLQVTDNWEADGVEQSVAALQILPAHWRNRCVLLVGGKHGSQSRLNALAQKYQLPKRRLIWCGERLSRQLLYYGADLMLHPALTACAAPQLIEALACRLPIICTAVCAYSPYVAAACCPVIPLPFHQETLDDALAFALPELEVLQKAVSNYVEKVDFTGRGAALLKLLQEFRRPKSKRELFTPELQEKIISQYQELTRFAPSKPGSPCHIPLPEGHFTVKAFATNHFWPWHDSMEKFREKTELLRGFTPQWQITIPAHKDGRGYLLGCSCGTKLLSSPESCRHPEAPTFFAAAGEILAKMHVCGIFPKETTTHNFAINEFCRDECPAAVCLVEYGEAQRHAPPTPMQLRVHNATQFICSTGCAANISSQLWRTLVEAFRLGYSKSSQMLVADQDQFWQQVWQKVHHPGSIPSDLPL